MNKAELNISVIFERKAVKRFYFIMCVIFLTSISAIAQNQVDWQPLAPKEEEFSVEVPPGISITVANEAARDEANRSRRYKNVFNGMYFFVFSDSLESPVLTNGVLDFAKYFKAAGKSFQGNGLTSEKFSFQENQNFQHTILIVKTRKRSYVFQFSGRSEHNPQMERFFASIKFDGKTLIQNKIAKNSSDNISVSNDSKSQGTGTGRGSGAGSGIGTGTGSGVGSGSGAGNGALINRPVITPLVILSKPQISGTNFAHLYQINGIVRLRVTFLANGTIGNVSPVTGLPFAITRQATEAAKSIKFEPAKTDGQPTSVTRMIEYAFNLD